MSDPMSIVDSSSSRSRSPAPYVPPPIYDLSPLLTAPAVRLRAFERCGVVPIVSVPETQIPSPLVKYITPERLLELKEHLCGRTPPPPAEPRVTDPWLPRNDGSIGPGSAQTDGNLEISVEQASTNGPEIWASWKRAYDLWHGFYIGGRINKSWVGGEYLRIKRALNNPTDTRNPGDPEKWITIVEHGRRSRILNPKWTAHREKAAIGGELDIIGQGGGFLPMQRFKEFMTPEEEAPGGVYVGEWMDSVENTIWRPKRLGEDPHKPVCGIDEPADVGFTKQAAGGIADQTGYNGWVDGGVDSGRSPFPVLRPKYVYTHTHAGAKEHEYTKHLNWDGVTSTIFNMPMRPLIDFFYSSPKLQDLRLMTNQTAYGDEFRDTLAISYGWTNIGTFPLDIRRILRKPEDEEMKDAWDEETEAERVELGHEFPLLEPRNMQQNDPWYVTPEQRRKRDVPSRLLPPSMRKIKQDTQSLSRPPKKGELFPLDAKNWRDEVKKDRNLEAEYFITNLHGGTVLVNGMEIKKGYTAGPLPSFAVIECPGGQIAFWWGVGGRDHGDCYHLATDNWGGSSALPGWKPTYTDKWAALRALPGWKYVGMLAGDVWREKIMDRMEREKSGDDLWDDGEWISYQHAWLEGKGNEIPTGEANLRASPPVWNGKFGSPAPSFASPRDELEHLVLKTETYRRQSAIENRSGGVIYPQGDAKWAGHNAVGKSALETAANEAANFWTDSSRQLLADQLHFATNLRVGMVHIDDQDKIARLVEGMANAMTQNKRKSDDDGNDSPEAKRIRSSDEELIAQYGTEMERASRLFKDEKNFEQRQIEMRCLDKPISEHNRIAAEYRQQRADKQKAVDEEFEEENKKRLLAGSSPMERRGPRHSYSTLEIEQYLAAKSRIKKADAQIAAKHRAARKAMERDYAAKQKREADERNRSAISGSEETGRRREEFEKTQAAGLAAKAEAQAAEEAAEKRKQRTAKEKFEQQLRETRELAARKKAAALGGGLGGGRYGIIDRELEAARMASLANLELEEQRVFQAGIAASLDIDVQLAERGEALKHRAGAENMTPEEYAQREGYGTVKEYLVYELTTPVSTKPVGDMTADDMNFLTESKGAYRDALTEGIKAAREVEGISAPDYLRHHGWHGGIASYIENRVERDITLADRPSVLVPKSADPLPRDARPEERVAHEAASKEIRRLQNQARAQNDARWRALQKKIFDAADFESQITMLERTGGAGKQKDHNYFGKGLEF